MSSEWIEIKFYNNAYRRQGHRIPRPRVHEVLGPSPLCWTTFVLAQPVRCIMP